MLVEKAEYYSILSARKSGFFTSGLELKPLIEIDFCRITYNCKGKAQQTLPGDYSPPQALISRFSLLMPDMAEMFHCKIDKEN